MQPQPQNLQGLLGLAHTLDPAMSHPEGTGGPAAGRPTTCEITPDTDEDWTLLTASGDTGSGDADHMAAVEEGRCDPQGQGAATLPVCQEGTDWKRFQCPETHAYWWFHEAENGEKWWCWDEARDHPMRYKEDA